MGLPEPGGDAHASGNAGVALKLGRYEIVRELGKGAMGIVYLAKDPLIGRLVALKTIRHSAHADEEDTREFQQRFVREAQAAGILNHPSIVTVHDIGQDDAGGMSFIAMEYVEGHNLKEVLMQGRPLNFHQIAEIIAQVAEALDFAHSKGIIHRDVKPANVILLDGNRAKITDFGIAKITSGGNLTSTGQFLGTPNYMAPEQIKGAPVDGRSDIFSLGICLYECLTRRKPFGGDSLTSISYKIVHEPFPPLQEVNPQIPGGYEEVVSRCLAKDPAKRFQRGKDLAAALRAVIRGEAPAAEPPLADETVITRDRDRLPTMEIPFPEAHEADVTPRPMGEPLETRAATAARAPLDMKAPVTRPDTTPVMRRFHQTMSDVRAYPLWRRPVSPPLFLTIAGVLTLIFLGSFLTIRSRIVRVPVVDTSAEAKHARERTLRRQGNELLAQGRVTDAFNKYVDLNKLAPTSPAINAMLQKLAAIRYQEEITNQQFTQAKAKFDEGLVLFNQSKYSESIPLFQEAFTINPTSEEAKAYLKLAQQGEQMTIDVRAAAKVKTVPTPVTPAVSTPAVTTTQPAVAAMPSVSTAASQLTTIFNGPFTDGYVLVKAGSDVLAHQLLWEEKGRFRRRRFPRPVNVTKQFPPKNTDLEVWVVVPNLKIQEHRAIKQNFKPGTSYRLQVTYDATSKSFDFQLN